MRKYQLVLSRLNNLLEIELDENRLAGSTQTDGSTNRLL